MLAAATEELIFCKSCERWKHRKMFYDSKCQKNGRFGRCKMCHNRESGNRAQLRSKKKKIPRSSREPAGHDVWKQRSVILADLIYEPLTTQDVINLARAKLKWTPNMTVNVLASGENRNFYYMHGTWRTS